MRAFRGMDIVGNWYCGNLTVLTENVRHLKEGSYISNAIGMPFAYQVRPETVGQSVGLEDKKGVPIYEGDIVDLDGFDSHGDFGEFTVEFKGTFKVEWRDEIAGYDLSKMDGTVDGWSLCEDSRHDLTVIGNIHEIHKVAP